MGIHRAIPPVLGLYGAHAIKAQRIASIRTRSMSDGWLAYWMLRRVSTRNDVMLGISWRTELRPG
jgi:hypothetical protein